MTAAETKLKAEIAELDLKAAAERFHAIEDAKAKLVHAQRSLDLVNEFGRRRSVWKMDLQLHKCDEFGNPIIIQGIIVPFGVVQQQALNAVNALRREIIKLGGTP